MATTKAHIRKLIDRIVQLPSQDQAMFGIEPKAIRNELGCALERFATSDEHATKMVDWLLFHRPEERRIYRPVVGEIKESVDRLHFMEDPQGPYDLPRFTGKRITCPHGKCDGSGWLIVERDGASGADACQCRPKGAA